MTPHPGVGGRFSEPQVTVGIDYSDFGERFLNLVVRDHICKPVGTKKKLVFGVCPTPNKIESQIFIDADRLENYVAKRMPPGIFRRNETFVDLVLDE